MSELEKSRWRFGAHPWPASAPSLPRALAMAVVFSVALASHSVRADDTAASVEAPPQAEVPSSISAPPTEERNREKYRQRLRALTSPRRHFDLFSTVMMGDGVRFNNPYRLSHQLGTSGESLSATAPYIDIALVVTTGDARGVLHGARIGWSWAMSGVTQQVITPSYAAVLRPGGPWLVYGWLGIPVVTRPDFVVGGELAVGATFFVRAGLGATCALVADGFYGAGTRETRAAFYPVLSGQLGLSLNYEVLP